MATKKCSRCKQMLSLTAFGKRRTAPDGLQGWCRICFNAARRQWRAANPGKSRAGDRRRWKTNPAIRCHTCRKSQLRKKYSMSMEDYESLFKMQNGKCAICGHPPNRRRLGVDHDHNTGAIRGLLCSKCNAGIGSLDDDPQRLQAAIDYLARADQLDKFAFREYANA